MLSRINDAASGNTAAVAGLLAVRGMTPAGLTIALLSSAGRPSCRGRPAVGLLQSQLLQLLFQLRLLPLQSPHEPPLRSNPDFVL